MRGARGLSIAFGAFGAFGALGACGALAWACDGASTPGAGADLDAAALDGGGGASDATAASDAARGSDASGAGDAGDAAGDAGDAAGDAGDAGCAPLASRHYVFTSSVAVPLGCDANAPAQIIDEPIPVTGRALGRATFTVHHTGTNAVTHFWNAQVVLGAPAIAFGLGDDVCPGATSARANIGLGAIGAQANRAKLVGYSGAAPCTPGTLEIAAGAQLEVWVEDDAPGCANGYIALGSYYAANGYSTPYDWTTSFTPLPGASATLTTDAPSETLRVIGIVEGTPTKDPNTACGSEASTIDLESALDGAPMAYVKDVVPASQGMGHRVLFTSGDVNELRAVTPGAHTAGLFVATDFVVSGYPVTTGGCCGDGEIALLRMGP